MQVVDVLEAQVFIYYHLHVGKKGHRTVKPVSKKLGGLFIPTWALNQLRTYTGPRQLLD